MTSVQSNVGSGTTRTVAVASPDSALPVRPLHRLRAVDELAFADAGADGEQQHQRVLRLRAAMRQAGPGELAAGDRRLERHAVEARRALDVAEARREAVDDR